MGEGCQIWAKDSFPSVQALEGVSWQLIRLQHPQLPIRRGGAREGGWGEGPRSINKTRTPPQSRELKTRARAEAKEAFSLEHSKRFPIWIRFFFDGCLFTLNSRHVPRAEQWVSDFSCGALALSPWPTWVGQVSGFTNISQDVSRSLGIAEKVLLTRFYAVNL